MLGRNVVVLARVLQKVKKTRFVAWMRYRERRFGRVHILQSAWIVIALCPLAVRLLPTAVLALEMWLRDEQLVPARDEDFFREHQVLVRGIELSVLLGLRQQRPDIDTIERRVRVVAIDVLRRVRLVHRQWCDWRVVRCICTSERRERRVPIDSVHVYSAVGAAQILGDKATADHSCNTHGALPIGVLLAAERVIDALRNAAVVPVIDEQSLLPHAFCLEGVNELADEHVSAPEHAAVDVARRVARSLLIWGVYSLEAEVDEEWVRRIVLLDSLNGHLAPQV
jgi:hypothetical protein